MARDRFGGETVAEGQTDRFGGSLVEQIPAPRPEDIPAPVPESQRIRTKSPFETGLEAVSAIPALAGVSKLFQLGTAGGRLAPYGARFAETFIPRTGTELAKVSGLTAAGGAVGQAAENLLPPDASPTTRFLVSSGAGIGTEAGLRSFRTALRGLRPVTPGGVERAAERVVRQMTPEQISALPQTVESKAAMVRAAQERLRGKPIDQPLDAADVATLLGAESAAIRQRGGRLGEQLAAGTEQRLAAISQPRTMEAVGADARKLAADRLKTLRDDRELATTTNKQAMLDEARRKELAGNGIENTQAYQSAVEQLKAFRQDPATKRMLLTGDTKAQFAKVKRELTGVEQDEFGNTTKVKVGFERLERLRRELGDRASGLQVEGYSAISQNDAKKLKKLVEDIMSEFTGQKFDRYVKDYERLSQPINQFATDVGAALTAPSPKVRGEMVTQASELPKKIFSTPENIDNFTALVGGDKAAVEGLARNYASAELAEKSPQQIRNWLKTNGEWLSRFPQLKQDFTDYATKLEQTGRVTKKLETRTTERAEALNLGRTQTEQADNFKRLIMSPANANDLTAAARVLGKTPEGANAFKSSVRDLIGTLPPGQITTAYRDRIKPAMQASGLYRPDEIKFVDEAIADIANIQNAISRASQNIGRTPGVESSAQELTRLINKELAQVNKGTAVAGLYAAGLAALGSRLGMPLEVGGAATVGGAVAGAFAIDRYRTYVANIRAAVSDIVTDPARLQQVLKTPPEKRQGVIASMIRQTIGTQIGAEAPERIENAPNER
jgi:hypothetical protein